MHLKKRKFAPSLKFIKLMPNMVTLMALTIALNSLKVALDGNWERAVTYILVAAVLDSIDGSLARFLNAASGFGAELDSLCDFANFGIFPALILYLWLAPVLYSKLLWNATIIYAICMVIRLARFNSKLGDPDQTSTFEGVPAPMGAILVLMPLILSFELTSQVDLRGYAHFIPFYIIAVGLLLASKIPTLSLKNLTVPKAYVKFVMLGFAIAIMELILFPWYTVPVLMLFYLCSIPYAMRLAKKLSLD